MPERFAEVIAGSLRLRADIAQIRGFARHMNGRKVPTDIVAPRTKTFAVSRHPWDFCLSVTRSFPVA